MMDCDTTGVEPDLALVKFKKLVGGGSMQIVNQTVPRALRKLGYQEEQIEAIVEHIAEHGNVVDAPGLRHGALRGLRLRDGVRSIEPMGHVNMMAAVQPFLCRAISNASPASLSSHQADGYRIGSLHDGEAEDTFRDEWIEIASLDGRQDRCVLLRRRATVRKVRLRSGHRSWAPTLRTAPDGRLGRWPGGRSARSSRRRRGREYGTELWSTVPASLRDITGLQPHGKSEAGDPAGRDDRRARLPARR